VFVPVSKLFQAVNRNDVVDLKWLLEGNGCKSMLDQPENTSGLSLLMTAALAGKNIQSAILHGSIGRVLMFVMRLMSP